MWDGRMSRHSLDRTVRTRTDTATAAIRAVAEFADDISCSKRSKRRDSDRYRVRARNLMTSILPSPQIIHLLLPRRKTALLPNIRKDVMPRVH